MPNRLVAGLVAGAAGTAALNVTTYLDMVVRGRPPSQLPGKMAGKLAEEMELSLDFDLDGAGATPEMVEHRREAVGALLGYGVGLGIGFAYGFARFVVPRMPLWMTSAALGSAAMAASDVPATRMGMTDPKDWDRADWAADVIPHAVYGFVTALVFEAIRD